MRHAFRLRGLIALVAAILTVTGVLLTGTTAAGASTASTASTTSSAAAKSAATKSAAKSAAKTPDYASVCEKPNKVRVSCFTMRRTDVKHSLLLPADTAPQGYSPADIQSAYDLPAASGSPLVAIVDAYDDPTAASDLATYRAQFGLPACTAASGCFQQVGQDGSANLPSTTPPGDPNDWPAETSLDLDAVSAACPDCRILLVEANDDSLTSGSLEDSVETAYNMGARIISMSWGQPEDGTETSKDAQYFDHPGVAYVASSGDFGYSGPIWPSTSQYSVSVGGTTLTQDAGTARGWSETAWDQAGSGCSADVAKPEWQSVITACGTRADTDLSADADPDTGLAIYNTTSDAGWDVYGGTSLAAPLIAGMYADAGTPAAGTWPASYPYLDQKQATDLNDVTSGATGACTPSVLCTAGPGWDGPTGLGTPDGVGALTAGPHGFITGTVTDAGTGQPVAGVSVSAGGYTATTDASGDYEIEVLPGSYTVTASKWAYDNGSASGVSVADGASVTENFELTATPASTLSGTVTDGSGHKWPMRAKITVSGDPSGPVYSSSYNGKYSVTLPDNASYTLSVSAMDLPGYTSQQVTATVGTADVTKNIALTVDQSTCAAPGYAYENSGLSEDFTGWTGNTPQDGWTVTDAIGNGETWRFDDPSGYGPPPGGSGAFAEIYSEGYGLNSQQDTSLVSPVIDLSGAKDPQILFANEYINASGQTGEVDLSLDGGSTWTTTSWTPYSTNPGEVDIPIPQAAGRSDVRVRFHFTFDSVSGRRWEIDNVLVGEHTCAPVAGGLVAGVVHDANTAKAVNGVTVTSASDSAQAGVTGPTTGDPGLPKGYYWLFSSHTGTTGFTLTGGNYASTPVQASVSADTVTRANFAIDAARLTVSEPSVSVSEVLGAEKTATVTIGNSGTAPATVSLSGADAGFTALGTTAPASAAGAAPVVVKTKASLKASLSAQPGTSAGSATVRQATAEAGPWADVADYPTTVTDDAVAEHDGKIYVVGGNDGAYEIPDANVYDPSAGTWSAIAPLPEPLGASSAAFIGDTLYVAGGWDSMGNPSSDVWAYSPGTNSWTQVASLPAATTSAGTAVVGGKLYVIGGCSGGCAAADAAVYSYDPGDDSWTKAPKYPVAVQFPACGGVDAVIVCAGGAGGSSSTYTYAPGAAGWVAKAAMPDDAWGAAATTANGQLDVIGGVVDNSTAVTNEGFAYDPSDDTWSALPNSNDAFYRGGAACGIYQVGGAVAGGAPEALAQNLPGYDQCGGTPDWMSLSTTGFDISPGQTVTVQVTVDSSALSQPGTYAGQVVVGASTPYPSLTPVGVTLVASPPKTWGEITGTVTGTSGAPVSGATIAICTMYSTQTGTCGPQTFTLKTDRLGDYQLWLSHGFSPLEIIAAEDGYTPVMKIAKVQAGGTSTANFTLTATSTETQAALGRYLSAHQRLQAG
ncbi:MAG: carboxypeptidase regulatory-like domain-containing protein [Trebonia sp.]